MKTKKELKAEYKQRQSQMGVFQILNKTNGMILIECATDMSAKWNRHRTELRFGSHRNKKLQNDWQNMGEENFEYSIVSELKVDEDDSIDLNDELKLLKEMVLEELNIALEKKY